MPFAKPRTYNHGSSQLHINILKLNFSENVQKITFQNDVRPKRLLNFPMRILLHGQCVIKRTGISQ